MNDDEFFNIIRSYQNVFGTAEGAVVLQDLESFIKRTSIDRLKPDANACVFRMGQTSIMEYITKKVGEKK